MELSNKIKSIYENMRDEEAEQTMLSLMKRLKESGEMKNWTVEQKSTVGDSVYNVICKIDNAIDEIINQLTEIYGMIEMSHVWYLTLQELDKREKSLLKQRELYSEFYITILQA